MDTGMPFIAATCTQPVSKLRDDLKVTHTQGCVCVTCDRIRGKSKNNFKDDTA